MSRLSLVTREPIPKLKLLTKKGVGQDMMSRKGLPGVLAILLTLAASVFAQETQTPPQDGLRRDGVERTERHRQRMLQRKEFGEHRMGRRQRRGRLMQELKLSEEQRQQSRAILQRRLQSTRLQREELFKLREKRIDGTFNAADEARAKALREEIRSAMQGTRGEMEGILNAEQKARLEQLKQERKERMGERIKERELRMKERQERLNMKTQ